MATKIQPDAPHPDSYRPDLPLRSELLTENPYQRGYDDGYETGHGLGFESGRERGRKDIEEELRDLRRQQIRARDRIIALEGDVTALGDELAAERRARSAPRAAEG
jgi:hypothetical protein